MQELWLQNNLGYFLLVLVIIILFTQLYISIRIKNMLQAIYANIETFLYFFRRLSASHDTPPPQRSNTLRTCQHCRHRLAYINTSKTNEKEEDFYHVCSLKNAHISLKDSCKKFEHDIQLSP